MSSSYLKDYQPIRPKGSLILNHSPNYHQQALSPKIPRNYNLDHKQNNKSLLFRYGSSQNLRKKSEINCKYSCRLMIKQPTSIKNQQLIINNKADKNANRDIFPAFIPQKSKNNRKQAQIDKNINQLYQSNKKLKQTTSTQTNEPLSACKSQKTLPSFLRNNSKQSGSNRLPPKNNLCKQNFKIIKPLGQGKFGVVNLAKQMQTGMLVALKIINKQKIKKQNLLTQLLRELKLQIFLDHQNIIKTFGFFCDQQNFYTVLQLGSDGQLYDIISTGKTLSQQSTSFIIGNLLDAVHYMHTHKILHRDIKPENIVLVHGNVKLCDFGWAVHKKEELRTTFCGTPLYLSPQLLLGEKYDEKIDLWAIGILAYELHLGQSPFEINEQDDLLKIITDDIRFPIDRKISKEFINFIRSILKKDPRQRLKAEQLLHLDFIRKYKQLQTCQELCK